MTALRLNRLIVPLAVILITVVGLWSAGQMAPDRGDAFVAQMQALGLDTADLCHDGGADHDHHCPFCRLLDAPALPRPAAVATALMPQDGGQAARDLHRRAQARARANAARAPPSLA